MNKTDYNLKFIINQLKINHFSSHYETKIKSGIIISFYLIIFRICTDKFLNGKLLCTTSIS